MAKQTAAQKKAALAKTEFLDEVAGQGFENMGAEDFQIPFLRILQALSPQVDEDSDEYVEGAKQGMFFNTVTSRLYGRTIEVIPLMYKKVWLEWAPNRGGLVARHDPGSIEVDKSDFSKWKHGENDVAEHHVFYVLCADHLDEGPMVFSLSSSGIKHARNWNTQLMLTKLPSGSRAPFFSSVWRMETVKNQNDQGTWYQVGERKTMIDRVRFITLDEFQQIVQPSRESLKALNETRVFAQLEDQREEKEDTPF